MAEFHRAELTASEHRDVTIEDRQTQPRAAGRVDDQSLTSGSASPIPSTAQVRLPNVEGYEILEVLGRGGMGVVYKAQQVGLKRIVALKMILAAGHAGDVQLARFRSEAESAARLQHPNIVQIYDVGESGGIPYFSQEYVDGGTLDQRLRGAPQPAHSAAEAMALLADAIDYAHQKGVVHRDLKPANVLLATEGVTSADDSSGVSRRRTATGRSTGSGSGVLSAAHAYRFGIPKIADFGLAKQLDDQSGRTESGSILGTPSYMAPEQAGGRTHEIGPAADIYALGAILYELLTGRPPFRGESSLDTLEQVRTREPVAPRQLQPKIPADLETICLKCLRKERNQRYATAGDLADDLRAFLEGRPISARPVGNLERGWRWCRRKPWTVAFLGASMLVVAAIVVGAWYRQQFLQSEQLARANDELAQTQRYYSLVNSARELAATAPVGWTWRAQEELQEAANSPSRLVDQVKLRSLAADSLTRFDVREPVVLAKGVAPSELAFRPDGKRLAIAENKNAVLLSVHEFDTETRERVGLYSFSTVAASLERLVLGQGSYQEGISSITYSLDGRWLVAGTRFGKLCRWDLTKAEPHGVFWQGHGSQERVTGLAFTADGSSLYSSCEEGGLKLWQAAGEWLDRGLKADVTQVSEVKIGRDNLLVLSVNRRLAILTAAGVPALATEPKEIYAHRLAVSPGGRFVACKSNSTARIVEIGTGREIRALALPEEDALASDAPVHHANDSQFSPDGSLLATSWADKRVRVWDVAAGRVVATLPIPGDGNPVARFSPDGRSLAVAAERETLLFDLHQIDSLTTIAHQAGGVQAIAFSPDGKTLVTNSDRGFPSGISDHTLAWWDVESGQRERESRVEGQEHIRFSPHANSVTIHPKGTLVAAGTALIGTRLISSGTPPSPGRTVELPQGRPEVIVPESELETLEAAADVEVRSDPKAENGRAIRLSAGNGRREVLAKVPSVFREEGKSNAGFAVYAAVRVEASGNSGLAFEMSSVTPSRRNSVTVDLVRLPSHDYHWYLVDVFKSLVASDLRISVGTCDQPGDAQAIWIDSLMFVPLTVRSWPNELQVFPQGPLDFSPSGNRLWGVLDGGQVASWTIPELTVASHWDVASSRTILGKFSIRPLAAGDKWVLTGSSTGVVFVLSATTGKLEQTWRDAGRSIRALAIDPKEELAAAGAENGKLSLVKIPSGEVVATLDGHREAVESLAFRADGKWLVSGSHDRTVRIWERREDTFEPLLTLPAGGRVRSVRLSADGTKLAVLIESERGVRVWHLDRLNERLRAMSLGW